jgi:peroxiredoxin (alkyl hydroperoxide reductase subunit C)
MISNLMQCFIIIVIINNIFGSDDLKLTSFLLKPRTKAPLFKAKAVINDGFIDITLQQYIDANKWTVLLFYPYDYTFVCPTEIISFSEKSNDFIAIDTQVLAISTDSHHTHLAWSRTSRKDGGVSVLNYVTLSSLH